MDKYLDDFCEKHFYEFESLRVKTDTDEFFKHAPRMLLKVKHLVWLCVLLLLTVVLLSNYGDCKIAKLFYDVFIGLLVGVGVALFFVMRDKRIGYYAEVVDIIKARIQKIEEARAEANEHMMNKSAEEGLHLLQSTAQNAYEFAGYIEDRISHIHGLELTNSIQHHVTVGDPASEKEREALCSDSRRVIAKILHRLRLAITIIRQNVYGKDSWEASR